MNKDLAPPNNISKLYKEISSVLRTARANAEFGKGFDESNLQYMRLSIKLLRIVTHCVTN